MRSPSHDKKDIIKTYILGALGVLIGLGGLVFLGTKDAENWLWITVTLFGGSYLIIRAWLANK